MSIADSPAWGALKAHVAEINDTWVCACVPMKAMGRVFADALQRGERDPKTAIFTARTAATCAT